MDDDDKARRLETELLGRLGKPQQRALRSLLIGAVRAADEDEHTLRANGIALDQLVADAPIEALPDAARLHRVGGLVGRGLAGAAVPDGIERELREMGQTSGLRQLLVVGIISELGQRLDAAGISWIAMKGPVLAGHYYAAEGDRGYGDLDLLVAPGDFPAAVQLLEQLGYRHRIHNWALAEATMAGQISMYSDLLDIDLHWHLHYSKDVRRPFALQPSEMLDRRRDVSLAGVGVPTFDSVDTLLTLCFHAARSDGHRLIWLKDVERCLAVDLIDFDELVVRADRYSIGPPVGLILARAQRIVGAQVSDETIEQLLSPLMRASEAIVCSFVDPVQFHERNTPTRTFTRSLRSSDAASVTGLPRRIAAALRRRYVPPVPNETDDEVEKQNFLTAVEMTG